MRSCSPSAATSQLLHSRSSGLCSKILYQLLIHHQCLHGVLHLPCCYQPAHLDQLLVQKRPCQILPDWKQKKKKQQVEEQTTDGWGDDFKHWISAGVLHDNMKKQRLNQSLDLSSFVCMHWSWSQNCDNRLIVGANSVLLLCYSISSVSSYVHRFHVRRLHVVLCHSCSNMYQCHVSATMMLIIQ